MKKVIRLSKKRPNHQIIESPITIFLIKRMKTVFITGGTGYIGSRLIKRLLKKGYTIRAVVRKGSEHKLPEGCEIVFGNALDASTYQNYVPKGCIMVHLVGVAHPSPRKKEQFVSIDLVSVREAVSAAKAATVEQFIYVSVSQYPSKIMEAYQAVRAEGEKYIKNALNTERVTSATLVRPWYVLGPGHYWPLLLIPFYWLAKRFKKYRALAEAQDLVWINQMLDILEYSVENTPLSKERIFEVQDIKNFNKTTVLNNENQIIYHAI
jgi:nucleoside-diphosphate-sugar epimerase